MAYVNPYANTMNYVPSTLWEHPEPYKTDWSTFWGKADEDDEDEKDKDDQKGAETEVEKGAGSQLKSLWGDIVADMQSGYDLQQSQNMFNSVFGPGITAVTPTTTVPNTQQYVGDWQNPNYTGGNTQVYNAQDLNAVTTGLDATTTQPSEVIQAYQPSYSQQQQATSAYSPSYATQADVYAQYPELAQNALNQATIIGDAGQLSATSGGPFTPAQSLGLMDPQIAQDLMRSRTFDTTAAATRGLLEGTDAEIDFDAVTDGEKDWGDFW